MDNVMLILSIGILFTSISFLKTMGLFHYIVHYFKKYNKYDSTELKKETLYHFRRIIWGNIFRYFVPFFWGRISLMTFACEMWRFLIFAIFYAIFIKNGYVEINEYIIEYPSAKYFLISFFTLALIMPAILIRSENEEIK